MRNVLVTGGAGFIGSAFVRSLFDEDPDVSIMVLDALRYSGDLGNIPAAVRNSDHFEFWPGSVNDVDLVGELVSRSDVVVHFAAETHVARSLFSNREFFETDVLGTQAVANAVLRHANSVDLLVHISTSEVYGTALSEPMDEEHPLNPCTPYAAAKTGADRLVYSYVASYDLPAVIIRPFNNYGPGQHLEKVVPRFITSLLLNEPLTVHGDGSAVRDWIFVEDTVRAIHLALRAPADRIRGEVINAGTGRGASVLQIAQMLIEAHPNSTSPIEYMEDRLGQVVKHVASTAKAKHLIGFEYAVNLEDGLERTLKWYADNRAWWEQRLALRRVPVKLRDGEIVWY